MTILFPLLSLAVSTTARRTTSTPTPRCVAILIPAHNEAALLPLTLKSIFDAIGEAARSTDCTFRVVVGADGCTDGTETEARRMNSEVLASSQQSGKWKTLIALVNECAESDWIILADCGVSWPRELLQRLLPLLTREEVIGVAPAYRNDSSGNIERTIWGTEAVIKRLESQVGGPVSVHGATICYRTRELRNALNILSDRTWLNDDIVIPFYLRALYPRKRIIYLPSLAVREITKTNHSTGAEFRRRRRLVSGNIEWIRWLWMPMWKHNLTVTLLATRRVCRLLWVYWLGFTFLPLLYYFSELAPLWWPKILSITLCASMAPLLPKLKMHLESALASALAPFYLLTSLLSRSDIRREIPWK